MKKPILINNGVYHLYNRGVDKRIIFNDDSDRWRFIHDIFEFNDKNPAINVQFYFDKNKSMEVEPPYFKKYEREPRKLLVDVLAFCLMKNHYHLIVRQRVDDGIVRFMQKLGTGYTMYFNQKYERSGALFQGRYKAVWVESDRQMLYLAHYVHCNPLDYRFPSWRDGQGVPHGDALTYLHKYRWSSLPDYLGRKNIPSVTQRDFIAGMFGGPAMYEKDLKSFLKSFDTSIIEDVRIE